jgi:hypothetical protein
MPHSSYRNTVQNFSVVGATQSHAFPVRFQIFDNKNVPHISPGVKAKQARPEDRKNVADVSFCAFEPIKPGGFVSFSD